MCPFLLIYAAAALVGAIWVAYYAREIIGGHS
jgi:hypothetical protein